MDETPAAAAEAALRDVTERAIVLYAYVLEHAHGDEGVVAAVDVAIVVQHVLDTPGEPLALRPLARPGDLLLRDVEGAYPHAVFARHVQRQRAPAAAGFDDGLAGFQLQLAAHVVHLGDLGLIERGSRRRVVRAGIGHGAAEPQRVELVADVVVVVDVVARAVERIAMWAMQRAQRAPQPRGAMLDGLPGLVDRLEQLHQVALDREAAVAVGIAETQGRVDDDRQERRAAAKGDAGDARSTGCGDPGTAGDRKLHRR